MNPSDMKELFKKLFEILKPDMRSYYRIAHKAEVVRTYAADGNYWADVQPLLNNESVNEKMPVVERVEIPILIGGSGRGIVAPPLAGAKCTLAYYDGDPDYPWISNFRWTNQSVVPEADEEELIIQNGEGVFIRFGADQKITVESSGEVILSGTFLELNGNSDFAVKYNELNTAFEQLKTELNTFISAYNAAVYNIAGIGTTTTTSVPAVPATASITAAKAEKVKI